MKNQLDYDAKKKVEKLCYSVLNMFAKFPRDASVKIVEGDGNSIVQIHPRREDVGALIGRQGSIAASVKELLVAFGRSISHSFVAFEVVEPESSRPPYRRRRSRYDRSHDEPMLSNRSEPNQRDYSNRSPNYHQPQRPRADDSGDTEPEYD